MRVIIEIVRERQSGIPTDYFDVRVEHEGKVYCKREVVYRDVLNSLLDRIFDRAKFAIKEMMEREAK
jgi:hypothetical protein